MSYYIGKLSAATSGSDYILLPISQVLPEAMQILRLPHSQLFHRKLGVLSLTLKSPPYPFKHLQCLILEDSPISKNCIVPLIVASLRY